MEYTGSYLLLSIAYRFQQIYLYHQLIFLCKSFHGSIEAPWKTSGRDATGHVNRSMEVLKVESGPERNIIFQNVNRSMEVLKIRHTHFTIRSTQLQTNALQPLVVDVSNSYNSSL